MATVTFHSVEVEVGSPLYCKWDADHGALILAARDARHALGMNVEESYVICTKCRAAVPLKK